MKAVSMTSGKFVERVPMATAAEHLQIMAALCKGKADVKAGRVKTHAQVEKLFENWISK